MENQPSSRPNLIPFSLLSTSVFERSKKVSSASSALPVSYSASALPRTLTDGPASQVPIKRPQDEPHTLSPGTHQRIGFFDSDPFVQGQSRRGRQLYEGSNRAPEDRKSDDVQRPSNKRRTQSASPEPRKRSAVSIGTERQTRLTKSSAIELSPISPVTSPLTRSIAVMSPRSSSSEADDVRRSHRRQQHHHSTSSQFSSSHASSGRSPKKPKGSQKQGRRSSSKSRTSKRKRAARDSSDSSSESTSSDSDTDSSDSDDFDREGHLPGSASALRLHGVVHDLMLELERARTRHAKYCEKVKTCSRKIRNISRKLERHFRDLHESISSAPASTERALTIHRTSISHENMVSFMSARDSQSTTVDRRPLQNSVVPHSTVQYPSRPHPTVQALPPSAPERRSSAPSPPSSLRLAQQNDRMSIASCEVIETLTSIHADVRNKAFPRKPRNMVLCTLIAGPDMEDVMVTGSLDGSIEFWDLENRRVMSSISRSELNQPWSEDMCWVGKNVLAVASAHKEGVPLNHQLTLVHVDKRWTSRANLGQPGYTVSWKQQTLAPMPHDMKGGILCVESMVEGAEGISMATAGADKQIVHWRFAPSNSDGVCAPLQQQRIHSRHTSAVQTLCYAREKNMLFSGGSDCKVVGWDMVRSEVVLEYKEKDGRINSIQQNPVDPNMFLVCQALTCNQISLHDNRQRFERAVLCFGSDGADRLSKQILPSWHPNGAIVSCGMQTESKINIWDIRWKDVRRGPGQSIDVHDKRVFKAAFHPKQSFITSMSAAGSLAFIDFRLNPGTIVHR